MALALLTVAIVAACGSDPTPEPTATAPAPTPTATYSPPATWTPAPPTPTPEPTATPLPTPTPLPATPTPLPAGPGIDEFVITPETTGQDLIDVLSEEEVECIKSAVGDPVFSLLLGAPLVLATADPSAAAPLLGCLAPESAVYVGFAFLELQTGGWSPETRACLIETGLRDPAAALAGMSALSGQVDAMTSQVYLIEFYNCMNLEERVAYLLGFLDEVDSMTSARDDLVYVIPSVDDVCIRDALTDEDYDRVLAGTVQDAFDVSESVAACLTDEAYVVSSVTVTEKAIGELSPSSRACLQQFARDHMSYATLINTNGYDWDALTDEEALQITEDSLNSWGCMTVEEVQRVLGIWTKVLGTPLGR